jgi:hypothetical protein
MERAYAGIDVAFAKGKRLPIVVTVRRGSVVEPLPLRDLVERPPIGQGNARALDPAVLLSFAEAAAHYLHAVEKSFNVTIERIAIDAPSGPCAAGEKRRLAERSLDSRGISCIATPSAASFEQIRQRAGTHLAGGGAESRIPGANQLWMLVGFELFGRLGREWECIEVFPQAIVFTLGASETHKSKGAGLARQLSAASRMTNWPQPPHTNRLESIGFGGRSDKLDAYLSAWLASLNESEREALGVPPDDAIWIPRLGKALQGK